MRKLLLLRPEPGLSSSAELASTLGLQVILRPLFRIEPVPWDIPDLADLDALLLTSANAVRHAGPQLERLKGMPVLAVGNATAAAAREAGFEVATTGSGNVEDLLRSLSSSTRLLHLAGEDHRPIGERQIERRIVYRAMAIANPDLPVVDGMVVAVHSPRAGARLSELVVDRGHARVAAISQAAAIACGSRWERIAVAAEPNDKSLLVLAAMLCQTSDQ